MFSRMHPAGRYFRLFFRSFFAVDEKIFKVQKRKTEGRDEM